MLRKKMLFGMAVGGAALVAAWGLAPAKASADDARLNVTPAVYRVEEGAAPGGSVQLVRHHGYYGGRRWGGGWRGGWGWGGGYRGYGWRGYYRPRPFYGGYYGGPGFGYGYGYGYPAYGYPAYGYGYGYPGYGYGGFYGGGMW